VAAYRVIFWDVYGTLLLAQRGDLESLIQRHDELLTAFERTARRYSLPVSGEVLSQRFFATIKMHQDQLRIAHPEIRVEEVWQALLTDANIEEAREAALFFEQTANPKQLQPQAFDTLVELKRCGLRQGIISNGQFYTRIELADLLRHESECRDCTFESIFDPSLVFFSCDLGVAKPDLTAFRRALAVVAGDGIRPAECLLVGDSLERDIEPARRVGFTALHFGPDGDIRHLSQLLEVV
jgi:FMN phosphatase YigB (HAD superfamily)